MKVKQSTPYYNFSEREREREKACMKALFELAEMPTRIWEPFGGIGMTAELMSELWPGVEITAAEIDQKCVEMYRSRNLPAATIDLIDAMDHAPAWFDAAVLDFNRFTVMDLWRPEGRFQRAILERAISRRPKWIELTDSARIKLNMNYERYGLTRNNIRDYMTLLDQELIARYGYEIRRFSGHYGATYAMLEPK